MVPLKYGYDQASHAQSPRSQRTNIPPFLSLPYATILSPEVTVHVRKRKQITRELLLYRNITQGADQAGGKIV